MVNCNLLNKITTIIGKTQEDKKDKKDLIVQQSIAIGSEKNSITNIEIMD